jgi:F-type H+-transporting ATPase subunit delta
MPEAARVYAEALFEVAKEKGKLNAIAADLGQFADAELINFLELLVEKQRMTELFRIRRHLDELWKEENRRIEVTVTSAVELDPAVVTKVGEEIERQTGQ